MEFWPKNKITHKKNSTQIDMRVAREHLHHQYHLIQFENGHFCNAECMCMWVCVGVSASRAHMHTHTLLCNSCFLYCFIYRRLFFQSLFPFVFILATRRLFIGYCLHMEKETLCPYPNNERDERMKHQQHTSIMMKWAIKYICINTHWQVYICKLNWNLDKNKKKSLYFA